MGIEAFVHDGREYTYFGLFSSIIRMPILLVTSRLDGQMTAPSILVAWFLTALFSSLMLWRLRILLRGEALRRARRSGIVRGLDGHHHGWVGHSLPGGDTIHLQRGLCLEHSAHPRQPLCLAGRPGTTVHRQGRCQRRAHPVRQSRPVPARLGLLHCGPAHRGMVRAGTGGASNRRWALPMLAVGIVPFLVGCVITYAKFGIPIGLPMADQVWATVNAHRRYFLAANGGKAFNFAFLPSTLSAYFQPLGIRFGGIFPFVTPPGAPAPWLAGAVLDQSYPTASFTDTSPVLLLLGCWGAVTAFRPRGIGQVRLTRIILFGAAAGAGGVLLWGYISQRYLGDLLPFFVIAAGIGLIDIWRRLELRSRRTRSIALGTIVTLAIYCVAANLAIAAFPVNQWTAKQNARFVSVQKSLSFDSVASTVHRGAALPYWAPAGQIFATNKCSGLYLSTGNDMKDVPGQQIEHYTWKPIEESSAFTKTIGFTFNRPLSDFTQPVTLMTYGKSSLVLEPATPGTVRMHLYNSGTSVNWPSPIGWNFPVTNDHLHEEYMIHVTTDPNLKSIIVKWYGDVNMINHYLGGNGPAIVKPTKLPPGSPLPAVTVANVPLGAKAPMTLCQSLTQNH